MSTPFDDFNSAVVERLGNLVVERERRNLPPRVVIYGDHGTGKTTLAASAPDPIFVQAEDGTDAHDVPRLPQFRSPQDVTDQIYALISEDHPFKTVVLDPADVRRAKLVQKIKATAPRTAAAVAGKKLRKFRARRFSCGASR
jgi:Cdc6-like AAA superfamily ATPase